MKNHIRPYGSVFLAATLIAVSGAACSHSATDNRPYDSVVVDRSNPEHTVIEFNGACAASVSDGKYDVPGKKEYSVTENGKTYYFSSADARDRFMQNFAKNSVKADQMWLSRSEVESDKVADSNVH